MIEFLKAFVKVQKALKPAKKDSTNPHFKSSYADLASCYEACRDALSDNGFAVLQVPELQENGATILKTHLSHISGYELIGIMFVCDRSATPQQEGSALTYKRRYSLCTMVGIAPEDDDANVATEKFIAPKGGIIGPIKTQNPGVAGEYIIPFGPNKGKKIKDMAKENLEKTLEWCKKNDKAPEYQEAILKHLDILTQVDIFPNDLPPFEDFDR